MKGILSNYRYYVLAVLATAAFVCITSEPAEKLPAADWLRVLILTKSAGVAVVCIIAKLVRRWKRQGVIPELMDTVNNH